jgi:CubicO group peptidase (beta-lactamase class C family)
MEPVMRRISYRLILVPALLAAGCGLLWPSSDVEYPSYPWPIAGPEEVGIDPVFLEEAVDGARRLGYVRSLLVARHGRLAGEYYFGGAQAGRPWPLRSVTKSVTSALVGIALRQGKLTGVDGHIMDWFPEYAGEVADTRITQVTLAHLLTMTGGIPGDGQDLEAAAAQDQIGATLTRPLAAAPGTAFIYSSLGVHLLSGMLRRLYHRSTSALAWLELCEPLGISIPRWDTDLQGNPYGGTGAEMTPRDMARFGQLFLQGGEIEGVRILSESWVEASLGLQVGGNWTWDPVEGLGYGYLWWTGTLDGDRVHFASGYAGQFILICPARDLVVTTTAALTNDLERGNAQEDAILRLLGEEVLPAVTPEEVPPHR